MAANKQSVISLKVDPSLLAQLAGLPNRSEFIRDAILAALDSTCPLCRGTGILSPRQKEHWEQFARNHQLEECRDCHELHLICQHEGVEA
ncbi:MAG: ribbon-helix-helix domain-containing protein [Phycisphaerae bacterium]